MAAASNVFRRIMVAAVMFAVSFALMSAADEPTTQDTTDALLELLEQERKLWIRLIESSSEESLEKQLSGHSEQSNIYSKNI